MISPIQRRIGCVFVPVSDMARARRWYSRLLGLPLPQTSHEGKIADLPLDGETQIILDAHKPVENSSQPLFFLWTENLRETYLFLQNIEVEIVTPIEDIGSVSTLIFRDPDGNLLMVCQKMSG
jgi:predicted enzyme related to lactoylglutathione lyase